MSLLVVVKDAQGSNMEREVPDNDDLNLDGVDLAALHVAHERARIARELEKKSKEELLHKARVIGLDEVPDLNLNSMTKQELVRMLYGGTYDDQRARVINPHPVLENDEAPQQRAARLANEAGE